MGDARTAGKSVVLTDWPPGPDDQYTSICKSFASIAISYYPLSLRRHRDGRRRSVDPALGLGLGHALHAVRPPLELEHRVSAVALDGEHEARVPDRERLDRELPALGVPGQHPVQVARPQPGLLATGPGPDLDNHVLVIVRIPLDHREPDLLGKRVDLLAGGLEHRLQLRVLATLGEQLARPFRVVDGASIFGRELGGGLEIGVRTRRGREPFPIANHLGIGQLGLERREPRLDLRHLGRRSSRRGRERRDPRGAHHRVNRAMADVILYGDTERNPAMRHEVPVPIGDPLFAHGERRATVS